jgi:endonuclease/exonuclease/phosphatase family metal-dependent hydrolase
MDRRVRPASTAAVLASLEADVMALQEVLGAGPGDSGHAGELATTLDVRGYMAPARFLGEHLFGNLTLTRLAVLEHAIHDLTWQWREPRCCQRVVVEAHGRRLQIFNLHLGTSLIERRSQGRALARIIERHLDEGPMVVVGDFNEWTRGPATQLLSAMLTKVDLKDFVKRRRSYPGVLPLLHLDQVYHSHDLEVAAVHLPRTRRTLVASDHLPLAADLAFR